MLPENKKETGFALLPLMLAIVLIILLSIVAYFYWQTAQNVAKAPESLSVVKTPEPSASVSLWKTYENQENKFEISYPVRGLVWSKEGYSTGECGLAIKEEKDIVTVDNFYTIKFSSFDGTLDEYLVSQRAKNAYEIENIVDSGADEAVRLLRLKPDFEIAVGYPPLFYVKAVFKKGENIYLLKEIIHNPVNEGGCVQPAVVDPTKYPDIAKQEWDLAKSIKFN